MNRIQNWLRLIIVALFALAIVLAYQNYFKPETQQLTTVVKEVVEAPVKYSLTDPLPLVNSPSYKTKILTTSEARAKNYSLAYESRGKGRIISGGVMYIKENQLEAENDGLIEELKTRGWKTAPIYREITFTGVVEPTYIKIEGDFIRYITIDTSLKSIFFSDIVNLPLLLEQ